MVASFKQVLTVASTALVVFADDVTGTTSRLYASVVVGKGGAHAGGVHRLHCHWTRTYTQPILDNLTRAQLDARCSVLDGLLFVLGLLLQPMLVYVALGLSEGGCDPIIGLGCPL
jgi:hypothetical protein